MAIHGLTCGWLGRRSPNGHVLCKGGHSHRQLTRLYRVVARFNRTKSGTATIATTSTSPTTSIQVIGGANTEARLPGIHRAARQTISSTAWRQREPSLALAAICLLCAPLVVLGQGKDDTAEQTIKGLTDQWRQALLKNDVTVYDKLTADNFITIGTLGVSLTKAQIVEFLKSGTLKYESYDYSDIKVRLYGDTALVNCTLNQKGRRGDIELIGGPYLVVLVWVKRNGQWQAVSWQGTRAAVPQSQR